MEAIKIMISGTAIASLCHIGICADNYFIEGTKWITDMDVIGESGIPEPKQYIYELCSETENGDGAALRMIRRDGDKVTLEALTRTEGDKVYFLKTFGSSDWELLYDFGLTDGESCEAVSGWGLSSGANSWTSKITCIDITEDKNNPGIDIMNLSETAQSSISGPIESKGVWIKGIGSPANPLWNIRFDADRISSKVSEVICQNKTIYKAQTSGSTEVIEDMPEISINDGCLNLSGESGVVAIYDLSGRKIAESKGDMRCVLPARGIYLVKTRGGTAKVRY